jgi:hypothetical protein
MGLDDVKEDLQEERQGIMEGETQEEKEAGSEVGSEEGPSYQNHDDFFMEEPQEVSASPDLEVATGRTAAETPGGFVNNAVETPEPRVVNVNLREKEDFFSDSDEEEQQPRKASNERKNYFSDSEDDN